MTYLLFLVHLADPFPHSALQVVPREPNVPRAGMMEALLTQMQLSKNRPHLVYASSYEVYPQIIMAPTEDLSDLDKFEETMTLTTPQSLRGASKIMDEVIAKLYFDEYGIVSVGLRYFSVYGPWNAPGSPWFELAERAVQSQLTDDLGNGIDADSVMDFIYIDDAVDATLLAMQTQRTEPFVVNIASGQGTSWKDLTTKMIEFFPTDHEESKRDNSDGTTDAETNSSTYNVGSIRRAQEVLGFRPQISLDEGLRKVLAWHWDRAYPYGGAEDINSRNEPIVNEGIVSCLPTDSDCLHGTPVFPCASECSHDGQCIKSYWDAVLGWTQALTEECTNVLYTVALDPFLDVIPSAHIRVDPNSDPFVNEGSCNLAFVSTSSPLVKKMRGEGPNQGHVISMDRTQLLRAGLWTLIPVESPPAPQEQPLLALLPKLSPGLFFSNQVERAIYVEPDVLVDSLPKLLEEASMQPQHPTIVGATALLIGKHTLSSAKTPTDDFIPQPQIWQPAKLRIQQSAYRMIRVALSQSGLNNVLDSRWMVHRLNKDDARLFRCDVAGEILQWGVQSDEAAWEFVLELHDLWSRIVLGDDETAWWTEDTGVTAPEVKTRSASHRRLQQEDPDEVQEEDPSAPDEDDVVEKVSTGDSGDLGDVQSGFGMRDGNVEEIITRGKKRGDSLEQDDDILNLDEWNKKSEGRTYDQRDYSAYDTWMRVLSASSTKYFVRIVPSAEVGVLSLADYENGRTQ